ncbi:MAG: SLBB domain-containing protein [Desulfobacterota bacterium]|nr:SLBB domain-containing protein [Thermodesulfobacteriota bacterium]
MKLKKIDDLAQAQEQGRRYLFPETPRINIGTSSCCIAKGALNVLNTLSYGLKSRGIAAEVVATGCTGFCFMEPTVEVQYPGKPKVLYGSITESDIPLLIDAIAQRDLIPDRAILRTDKEEHIICGHIAYADTTFDAAYAHIPELSEHEFLKNQQKVILRNAGNIDPENIYEYIGRGGYQALCKALSMNPDVIIQEIIASGLRGRGGGGFPTGLKWKSCKEAAGKEKYLICNVSEGEPGIGMHRSFLESDPHAVLEGLIIGGYAIGAQTAYVYIRDNYRTALKRFTKAVQDAFELGLLGNKILGTSFNFNVKIKEGGGRFVCGEETALIACIEGRIGEPRQRPPFPTVQGLFNKPTCINNVETWANIPVIIMKGSSWYSSIGNTGSKGTKVISLAGNIARPGMIEVPMGTPLHDIIYTIGGGIAEGKQLKAVQTGGPSGGVLPSNITNICIDYDVLKNAGSMLGSGGMVIMDEDTDMVKIAHYFTEFFAQESCGKCVPCREGIVRMCKLLDEIIAGYGSKNHLDALQNMAFPIMAASACALGKTAPVPVISTLKHFRKDYLKYITT